MPKAVVHNTRSLTIALAEGQAFYPGDTIIGTVRRSTTIVDSQATITIKLNASAKVKITHHSTNGRSYYRQRINFFTRPPVSEVLHRGPVHLPRGAADPLSWPFALDIPLKASEGMFQTLDHDAIYKKPADADAYELPATFESGVGTDHEFYIEYVLVATLRTSKGDEAEATLPIQLRRSASPNPISDFRLKKYRDMQASASSYQLDPDQAGTELTFKQKARDLFGSSKVPSLSFKLQVTYPSVLQIGHPEPAPFYLRAVMNNSATSEPIQGTFPALIVTRFQVKLSEDTSGITPGLFSGHEESQSHEWSLLSWRARNVPELLPTSRTPSRQPSPAPSQGRGSGEAMANEGGLSANNALTGGKDDKATDLPPSYESGSADEPEAPPPNAETLIVPWESALLPLDVGQALGLRVPSQPKYSSRRIQPSLKAICIKTQHRLSWELNLKVAGEVVKLGSAHRVEILGPSDDDMYS